MTKWHSDKRFIVVDADADEMSEHYRKTLSPVRVEPLIATGRISVEDKHYLVADWSIWGGLCRSGMNVSFLGGGAESIVLYLPRSGEMTIRTGKQERLSQPGSAFVGDMSCFDSLKLGAGRSHLGVAFSKAQLVRSMAALTGQPIKDPVAFLPDIRLASEMGHQLSSLADFIWRSLEISDTRKTSEFFFSELMSAFSILLLETAEHNYSAQLSNKASPALPRQVKKAIEFMQANAAGKVSVVEISEASGASVRSLQHAFKQFKDTTPLNYLRLVRLEGARRDLLDSNNSASVSEIARKWGFMHMGRFASAYFRTFGELPSSHRGKHGD